MICFSTISREIMHSGDLIYAMLLLFTRIGGGAFVGLESGLGKLTDPNLSCDNFT